MPMSLPVWTDRQRAIQDAWKAYRGQLPDPLKVTPGHPNDNVRVNRCAPIVDKGVEFLFGETVNLTHDNPAIQEYLDGCWGDDDQRMTLLVELATSGALAGHAFVKLQPADEARGVLYPTVVLQDSQNMTVTTDPDDCSVAVRYTIEYDSLLLNGQTTRTRQCTSRVDLDGNPVTGATLTNTDHWEIVTFQQQGGNWIPQGEPVVWPYTFAPILDCKNLPNPHSYWGQPDITPDIINMNQALNFTESNTSRMLKLFAHPWPVAKNTNMQQVHIEPGRIINLPGKDADLQLLQTSGDVAGAMAFAASLRADMDEQSGVPGVALGRHTDLPKGTISGVALQMLYGPLMKKTQKKRRLYGQLLRAICSAFLELGGFPADSSVEIQWPSMLPSDDTAAVQTSLLKQQIGVSDHTLLTELGYDPDVEADLKRDEGQQQVTAFSRGQGMPPPLPKEPLPEEPVPV